MTAARLPWSQRILVTLEGAPVWLAELPGLGWGPLLLPFDLWLTSASQGGGWFSRVLPLGSRAPVSVLAAITLARPLAQFG